MESKKVILVTDGDKTAGQAVAKAGEDLELNVIFKSQGVPTPYSGEELIELITEVDDEPVVVMVDDNGEREVGPGERALRRILEAEKTEVLGVLAVASNTKEAEGIIPDISITKEGKIVKNPPVNKAGDLEPAMHVVLEGDTVDVLNEFSDLLIVGVGDLGKMEGKDNLSAGSPITKQGLQEILARSGE